MCELADLLLPGSQTDVCVSLEACEVCVSEKTESRRVTPTVWSLVYNALQTADDLSPREQQLQRLAEECVVASQVGVSRPSLACCDVVLCVTQSGPFQRASALSIIDQQHASVRLHIVDDGGGGCSLADEFAEHPQVTVHRNERKQGPVRTLHRLLPTLTAPFVALQDEWCTARSTRVAASVQRLMEFGDSIVGTFMFCDGEYIQPVPVADTKGRFFPWQTLAFRKTTLIDLNGFAVGDDEALGLLLRTSIQQRRVGCLRMVTVDCHRDDYAFRPPVCGLHEMPRSFLSEGAGFPQPPVNCDVVLPFRDHLEYVEESLTALLNQVNCRPVIHLVDDASRQSIDSFLNQWKKHPQVRIYRNSRNVGQFTSFNNVLPWVESEWVAVQDADDISQPDRLWQSVNALRLAKADIFGCAVELFGAERTVTPNRQGEPELQDRSDVRYSFHPIAAAGNYFLENPTAVFRVEAFKSLGGFADFGNTARNRASLDTEFYIRAHHAGARIFTSRRVLLRYRCHPESATQNNATGWGTDARIDANAEVERRCELMRSGSFDPRVFGALGKYQSVTQRWT